MKKITFLLAVVATVFSLTACNTFQGVGRDVRATGNAIERAAQ